MDDTAIRKQESNWVFKRCNKANVCQLFLGYDQFPGNQMGQESEKAYGGFLVLFGIQMVKKCQLLHLVVVGIKGGSSVNPWNEAHIYTASSVYVPKYEPLISPVWILFFGSRNPLSCEGPNQTESEQQIPIYSIDTFGYNQTFNLKIINVF